MPLTKDQDVIQAVAPKRPDQAFNIGVLPGRPRCDRAIPYPHSPDPIFESLPVGTVIVAHQIARRRIPGKCLHHLLRQPFGGRVPRNGKPEQLPATVAYDEKRKQALKCQGSNHAEIDCRNGIRVVAQECPPGLRRRPSVPVMYLETVDSAVSNPSFSSSPWMRGAPHKGSPCSSDG